MSAIFEEVTITWGVDDEGQPIEWKVTPTYKMVQQIEQRFSIAGIGTRILNGDPPISHMAEVIAVMLRHAGCHDVTPEDIYAEFMVTDDEEFITDVSRMILEAFVPQKKSGLQGSGQKGKKSKAKK